MADFWTLQTRVQRRVIDLPASVISEVPDLINEAIRDLQDSHNFHVMRTLTEETTAAATRALLAKPALFKQLRGRPFYTSFASATAIFRPYRPCNSPSALVSAATPQSVTTSHRSRVRDVIGAWFSEPQAQARGLGGAIALRPAR